MASPVRPHHSTQRQQFGRDCRRAVEPRDPRGDAERFEAVCRGLNPSQARVHPFAHPTAQPGVIMGAMVVAAVIVPITGSAGLVVPALPTRARTAMSVVRQRSTVRTYRTTMTLYRGLLLARLRHCAVVDQHVTVTVVAYLLVTAMYPQPGNSLRSTIRSAAS